MCALLLMLVVSSSVRVIPEAPVNHHTPRGPYDHVVLDSLDAGLAALLPAPVYHVVQQVMRVVVQPTEVVKGARDQFGLDQRAAAGNRAAAHASAFLDSVLVLAVISGSVVGILIRGLLALARDRR
jgi:hypothetical protein